MLELLERQQRLTANQWKIISAAILGDMLDFFDFFLIGYVLAFIVGEWKLSFLESGMILLAAGIGAIPGAFFWGWMADRIGRRKVFVATVLNFSLATGLMAAYKPNTWPISVYMIGLALITIVSVYFATETRQRARSGSGDAVVAKREGTKPAAA